MENDIKNRLITEEENKLFYATMRLFPGKPDNPSIDTEDEYRHVFVSEGDRLGNYLNTDNEKYVEICFQSIHEDSASTSLFITMSKEARDRLVEILKSV